MEPVREFGEFKVYSLTSLPPSGVCFAVYGEPGSGKTTFACDAQYSEYGAPVCLLDIESGANSVTDIEGAEHIPISSWDKLVSFKDLCKKSKPPWKTIVIDNMSEALSLVMRKVAGLDAIQIQHWNKVTSEILFYVREWRTIAQRQDVNVVFIAWEAAERDAYMDTIKHSLAFNPALRESFPGLIDWVCWLSVPPNTNMRTADFRKTQRSQAKFRVSRDARASKIPLLFHYGPTDRPIVDLLAVVKGGAEWPTAKYERLAKLAEQRQ